MDQRLLDSKSGVGAMDLFNIQRGVMCSLAAAYGLQGDKEEFKRYYELFKKAQDYDKEHHDAAASAVRQSIQTIKLVCDAVPKGQEPLSTTVEGVGLGLVKRLPSDGRYVVFSDHHITDRDNRQNFFAPNNKGLYLDILKDYYGVADFDLIENGDVEELLIYEPDLGEMGEIGSWGWPKILSYRRTKTEESIRSIAADNADYYRVIYDAFASKKKYHKVVGNHDVALLDGTLMQLLRTATGYQFERPVETVLLSDNERHSYFICHGHQFDHSCTRRFAEYIGESYTQAGAWAFQGPDRTWLHNKDWLDDMLAGRRPVINNIVGTEPTGLTTGQVLSLIAAFGVGAVLGGASITAALASGSLSTAMLQTIFNIVPPQNFFEEVMQKNIAWEYFDDPDDYGKLINQIASGQRWFKVRHTEEIALTDFLANEGTPKPWGNDTPPVVVIGHSHEARLQARRPNGKTASRYINTAAAGRFENMIWGLEIVESEPSLVTWHRSAAGAPVRTLWKPASFGLVSVLQPASQATLDELLKALPPDQAPPDETAFRIAVMHDA